MCGVKLRTGITLPSYNNVLSGIRLITMKVLNSSPVDSVFLM
jgi:hypothetical protein